MCDQCSTPGSPAQKRILSRARMRRDIAQYGWHTTFVTLEPTLAYTTGLWELGHPEAVIFGLSMPQAHDVLGHIVRFVQRGDRFADEHTMTLTGAPPGLRSWTVFELPNPAEVLFKTQDYYGHPVVPVPALQFVYADRFGYWPWEDECDVPSCLQPIPGSFVA